ncbi:MAG: VanZ family protein [Frankiaceae bacterium]
MRDLNERLPGLLVAGAVLGAIAVVLLRWLSGSGRLVAARRIALVLLAGWLLLTAWATLGGHPQQWVAPRSYVNLRPFASFTSESARSTSELVANVVLFMPLGALLPFVVRRHRLLAVLAIALLLSAGIECFQYASHDGRFADIDDVILNVSGALAGWAAWGLLQPLRSATSASTCGGP